MQLRYETGLSGERYVTAQAWREARLERCPNHPRGGCSLARHGTYGRKAPRGARIARWYCPQSHATFSLLPDCLAAAADAIRRDAVELPGAVRWLGRRVRLVRNALNAAIGLVPDRLAPCAPSIAAVRVRLGSGSALTALRALAAPQLRQLPAPLGFHPRRPAETDRNGVPQHRMGRDPPPAAA